MSGINKTDLSYEVSEGGDPELAAEQAEQAAEVLMQLLTTQTMRVLAWVVQKIGSVEVSINDVVNGEQPDFVMQFDKPNMTIRLVAEE